MNLPHKISPPKNIFILSLSLFPKQFSTSHLLVEFLKTVGKESSLLVAVFFVTVHGLKKKEKKKEWCYSYDLLCGSLNSLAKARDDEM